MRLSNIFFVGTLLYGSFAGLQCQYQFDLPGLSPGGGGGVSEPSSWAATTSTSEPATATSTPLRRLDDDDVSIRDYVRQAIKMSNALAILYWNSSGLLDLPPLVEQCEFRNLTFGGNKPFHLQNVRISSSTGNDGGPKLALYPLTDNTYITNFNFSVPSPIVLIAHTLPVKIANNLKKYPWIRLLPTPYELNGSARQQVNAILKHNKKNPQTAPPFAERIPQIIYRGHINNERKPERQRTKLIEIMKSLDPANQRWLNASGEKDGQFLHPHQQLQYKYMMDVGGLSGTTWVSLRWKMCSGSLVLKVDSGFADWWHDQLIPYRHYVPVKRDFSDLYQQYLWAEEHPLEASQIVQNALDVCLKTTSLQYLRDYTKQQISSLPTPTLQQIGEYQQMIEASRKRLQKGKPPLLFNKRGDFISRNKNQKPVLCPPKLTSENV